MTGLGPVYATFAPAYLAAGFSPIPVRDDKTPHFKGYTGRDGNWVTRVDVERWQKHVPDAEIAIRLPRNVIGIDVDAYGGKRGAQTLAELESQFGPLPVTALSSARPAPSGIRLYAIPDEFADARWPGKAGPGVDIITWYERYMVVAPSLHGATGGRYAWRDWQSWDVIKFPGMRAISDLPAPWLDGLLTGLAAPDSSERVEGGVHAWLAAHDGEQVCDMLSATHRLWSERISNAGDSGGAHDAARDGLRAVLGDVIAGHTGGYFVAMEMRDAFLSTVAGRRGKQEAWNEFRRMLDGAIPARGMLNGKPMPPDPCEDAAALEDMRPANRPDAGQPSARGRADVRDAADLADPSAFEKAVQYEVLRQMVHREAKRRIAAETRAEAPDGDVLTDLLEQEDEDISYRCDRIWPADGDVLVTAQAKAGKTTLSHNLARSLCDGVPFLGEFAIQPIAPGKRLGILDAEMSPSMIRAWFRRQKVRNTDRLIIWSVKGKVSSFNILDDAVRAEWVARLVAASVEVLLIDCLAPIVIACGLDEKDGLAVLLPAIDALKAEAGLSEVVLIHHMGHTDERARGDSRLLGWYTAEWKLVTGRAEDYGDEFASDPSRPRYFQAYGRDVEVPEGKLTLSAGTGHMTIETGLGRRTDIAQTLMEPVQRFVMANPGCTQNAIFTGVTESSWKDGKSNCLRLLAHQGVICIHPRGRSNTHWPVDSCPDGTHSEGAKLGVFTPIRRGKVTDSGDDE